MARITPVKLTSSSKALWFDSNNVPAQKGNTVIVQTARGFEYGTVAENPFEATPEQLKSLKSALKPVCRLATPEDDQKARDLEQMGRDAMPDFRKLVEDEGLEMRPISVEYLFEGDKAVFYFEADDRVDFRDLVRKLASHFHVRVDMRQIGVRDEARMVGGLGHCGQELCCKRLGGEFCPVSIRMAKEQDLSLNPQKISGVCGRLMCCLRYEYDAYKDFKSRSPKVGATIETPDGNGKVVSLDVPREVVTIQVDGDKRVKVPLEDMTKADEKDARPNTVDAEAWERANAQDEMAIFGGDITFSAPQFTGNDKLGTAQVIRREPSEKPAKREKSEKGRSIRGDQRRQKTVEETPVVVRKPRRRSTNLGALGATTEAALVEAAVAPSSEVKAEKPVKERTLRVRNEQAEASSAAAGEGRRRRRRRSSDRSEAEKIAAENTPKSQSTGDASEKGSIRPGHKSSSLRQRRREEGGKQQGEKTSQPQPQNQQKQEKQEGASNAEGAAQRRRPRRRRRSSGEGPKKESE